MVQKPGFEPGLLRILSPTLNQLSYFACKTSVLIIPGGTPGSRTRCRSYDLVEGVSTKRQR